MGKRVYKHDFVTFPIHLRSLPSWQKTAIILERTAPTCRLNNGAKPLNEFQTLTTGELRLEECAVIIIHEHFKHLP